MIFCYAEFLTFYILEKKSNKTCEYQPDKLDGNLIENNHDECFYLQKINLIISGETMRCRKVRKLLFHHALLFFYRFGFLPKYQNKLKEEGFL